MADDQTPTVETTTANENPPTAQVVNDTPAQSPASETAAPAQAEAAPVETAPLDEAPASPATPEPVATPAATPKPRPVPKPGAHAKRKPAVIAIPAPTQAQISEAIAFGEVDAEGGVWVTTAEGKRQVGTYVDADKDKALDLYVKRYLDLKAQLDLFEARLETMSLKNIESGLATQEKALTEPNAVGDLDSLEKKFEAVKAHAQAVYERAESRRKEAKEKALAERTALVEQAEKLAEADPEKTHWKTAAEEFRKLLDTWKKAQSAGVHLDHSDEDALWLRLSRARTVFDRARRHFFTELEKTQGNVKQVKEQIIAQAEKLKDSTDWGATSTTFRSLMDQWKTAGRTGRKDDNALWERFRAAQDVFYSARAEQHAATNEEQKGNLALKLEILEKAEAILPVKNPKAARAALRPIQEQWDRIGYVPRADEKRVEGRMKAVEDAVRTAEEQAWKRSNPETKARATGMSAQLEAAITQLKEEIASAKAAGNAAQEKALSEALEAREAWLKQIESTAAELS